MCGRTRPGSYSHYIIIGDYTNENYMGKTIEVTMDLRKFGYESTKKGSPNYHILEGKVIGFWPPGEGSHSQRWECKCEKKFAVARIEWDEVFHSHEEFRAPMAVALKPGLCGGGDKHLAWQLFRPEFVEYLALQQAQEQADAAASAMDTGRG